MEELLGRVALSGATFVGKAAWSYAASMALKKISTLVSTDHPRASNTLQLTSTLTTLERKLTRKLSVVTPILDHVQILVAQGVGGLDGVVTLVTGLREELGALEATVESLQSVIDLVDELLPLLSLALIVSSQNSSLDQPTASSSHTSTSMCGSIPASRLLRASASLVESSNGLTGEIFAIKMYTLFEGMPNPHGSSSVCFCFQLAS